MRYVCYLHMCVLLLILASTTCKCDVAVLKVNTNILHHITSDHEEMYIHTICRYCKVIHYITHMIHYYSEIIIYVLLPLDTVTQ